MTDPNETTARIQGHINPPTEAEAGSRYSALVNNAVLDFIRTSITAEDVVGRSVLEVGALDVNGSARRVIEPLGPASYVGVDIQEGPGVDRIVSVSFLVDIFGTEAFDIVVATEMLEHVQDWRWAVTQLKRVVAPGGVLLVTTRSPGFHHHGYPHDFWRFTTVDFGRIFADLQESRVVSDPSSPGVFVVGRRPAAFEAVILDDIQIAVSPPPPKGSLAGHARDVIRRRFHPGSTAV